MKKTGVALLLSFFIGETFVFAAEEIKGPRIVMEEMEITFLRDGKVLKKMKVGRDEGMRLVGESNETVQREERFIDPPVLSFRDAKGRDVKRMVLKRPGKGLPSGGSEWSETVASAGIRVPTCRDAVVSGDGKYALVTEYFAGIPKETKKEASLRRHITSSLLHLYDAKGRAIFEQKTPDNTYVNKMVISSDGTIAGYIEVKEGGEVKKSASKNRLLVFDREKNLLLQFPEKKDNAYRVSSRFLVLSPSGRYLSVGAKEDKETFVTLFFDLKKGSRWKTLEKHRPYRIDDEGNAYIYGSEKKDKEAVHKIIKIKEKMGR